VRQTDRLGQSLIEAQRPRDGPADLRDLHAVRETRAVIVVQARREDLCLAFEPAESGAIDDPVPIPIEGRPVREVNPTFL
jgi:hypothetical protein